MTYLYRQSSTMSYETCHQAAIDNGYTFFGLQDGEECWASNSDFSVISQHGPSSNCNMTCPGDSSEPCGGW